MPEKVELSLAEKIDRAKEGRTQSWIVRELKKKGFEMSDPTFSRKKMENIKFTDEELVALSEILKTEIKNENND